MTARPGDPGRAFSFFLMPLDDLGSYSRAYLETLVEELVDVIPDVFVTEAQQRARPRAGGRSYPRRPPSDRTLSADRLDRLDDDALVSLRDRIDDLLSGREKVSPTPSDVHVPSAMQIDYEDEEDEEVQKSYIAPIIKADEEHQVVTAPVLVPGKFDSQGDRVDEADIAKAAFRWMLRSRTIGKNHEGTLDEGGVVESYIAPTDLSFAHKGQSFDVPAGAWILSVRLGDEDWEKAKAGGFRGFSIGGMARRVPVSES